MTDLEAIRKRARRDLVLVLRGGQEDVYLWEHSLRVTDTAEKLSKIPELRAQPIDMVVLNVVGLYHEASWASQYREEEISREEIRGRLTSPIQRELSAAIMERSLQDLLPRHILAAAGQCIRILNDHSIDPLEAQLVVEAANLNEFGAMAIWNMARKQSIEGKGLKAALDTWQTQQKYGYWTARINDSFRFDTVKAVARARLDVLGDMIETLHRHYQGEDIVIDAGTKVPTA